MRLSVAWAGTVLAGAMLLSACSSGSPQTAAEPAAREPTESQKPVDMRDSHPFVVQLADIGIHSFTTEPEAASGSIRLNCSPKWRDVETSRGVYDWAEMDLQVARTQDWGYADVIFVFCGTPEWAAGKPSRPEASVVGEKGTRPPRKMTDWEDFVRQVVRRYKGKITSYQAWNEASSPQFFSGSAAELAEMTRRMRDVVKSEDPDALVISASTQTHRDEYAEFFTEYLVELAKLDWPVDVFAVHGYPIEGGPRARVKQLRRAQQSLVEAGAPSELPLWDTEVNYDPAASGKPAGSEAGRIRGDKAAAWTAITYLDSWSLGIPRAYWYLWTDKYYSFPGIQTRTGDPATAALNKLADWVVGKRFVGCDQSDGVKSCRFEETTGDPVGFRIIWTRSGTSTAPAAGAAEACLLTEATCQDLDGPVSVSPVPTLVR